MLYSVRCIGLFFGAFYGNESVGSGFNVLSSVFGLVSWEGNFRG
jgi:hypothetical protein